MIAPGVIEPVVLLQTLKFTLLAVGYGMIVSIPVEAGVYPVTPVGSLLKLACTVFVVTTPVADTVTTVAHAPEEIADVPMAAVPARPPAPTRQFRVAAPGVIEATVLLQTLKLTLLAVG